MTRKEELIERAKKRIGSIYGPRAEHCMGASYDEYVQEVLVDYLQVEREVWEKVIDESNKKASSILISNEQQPFCDGFRAGAHNMALWCKAQQQEMIRLHDAEQRRVIEQLRKDLALLKADDAERCTLIRDMEEEERRKDQEIEEARRTAEYWKAEHLAGNPKIEQQAKRLQELEEWQKIVTGTGTNQEAVVRMAATEYTKVAVQCWKEKCEQQAQQIATLREALQLLYDVQNGCPLPKYQADWDRAMELTQQALKEVKP